MSEESAGAGDKAMTQHVQDNEKPNDIRIRMMVDLDIRNEQGKPMLEIRFKRQYGYILVREYPQNMSDEDVKHCDETIQGMKYFCKRIGYRMYNFDDLQRQMLEQGAKVPRDGQQHDIKVQIKNYVSDSMDILTIGVTFGEMENFGQIETVYCQSCKKDTEQKRIGHDPHSKNQIYACNICGFTNLRKDNP